MRYKLYIILYITHSILRVRENPGLRLKRLSVWSKKKWVCDEKQKLQHRTFQVGIMNIKYVKMLKKSVQRISGIDVVLATAKNVVLS